MLKPSPFGTGILHLTVNPTPTPSPGIVFTYSGSGVVNTLPFEISSSPWKLRYTANWDGHFALQAKASSKQELLVNHGVSVGKVYETYVYGFAGSTYFSIQSAPANGNWTLSVVAGP